MKKQVKCYLSEYVTPGDVLNFELREKHTARTVAIATSNEHEAKHFTKFLSVIGGNKHIHTAIMSPTEMKDYIYISGHVLSEDDSEIVFNYDTGLTYLIM